MAQVKYAILVTKYMNMKKARAIYKKQADRVGVRFEEAEKAVVAANPKYKSVDLSGKWKVFIKAYTTKVSERIAKNLDAWVEILERQIKLSKDPEVAKKINKNNSLKEIVEKMEGTVKEAKKLKADKDFKNGGFTNPYD